MKVVKEGREREEREKAEDERKCATPTVDLRFSVARIATVITDHHI